MSRLKSNPRLILALDVDTLEEARSFVNRLYPEINIFKVGSRLFTSYGPRVVEMIRKKGAQVFLDLKYFDIPNTVAGAVEAAVRLEVGMLTLHVSGGSLMLKAAVEAAARQARILKVARPLLLGVTVLTSQEAGTGEVFSLARQGLRDGLDGIVCSAREAGCLRKKIRKDFVIVTPGIRPGVSAADDQKRTATAAQAVKAGSDFLVIGRPILKAGDPLSRAREILGELNGAGN
ncbi:MAG: orotidine-5'-phosphate decarboxylase [Candidatus Omnitrophota bacterium]